MASWIVVSDFDGTFTERDVGNELCKEALGVARFDEVHQAYRRGEIGLKELQQRLWTNFPMNERTFRAAARRHATLRPGVVEFLTRCQTQKIPVYIASCGVRPYIEESLDALLPAPLRPSILEIRCNEAEFDAHRLSKFTPPASAPDCPYPLDKGDWAREIRARYPAGTKAFAIGNGTSDRSFWPHVDKLAACEALATWCAKENVPHKAFEDFRDLMNEDIFA